MMNIKENTADVESSIVTKIAANIAKEIDQEILSKMNATPGMIYLNQNQCEHFGLPYFERSEATWLKASEILGSKWQGYDEYHRELLVPRGDGPVLIHRDEQDAPGWYNVTG